MTGRATPVSVRHQASTQQHLLPVRRWRAGGTAFGIGVGAATLKYDLFNDGVSGTGQREASAIDTAALTACWITGRAPPVSARHRASTPRHLRTVRSRGEQRRSAFSIGRRRSGTYELCEVGASGASQRSASGIDAAALTNCSMTTGRAAPVSVRHRASTQRNLHAVRRRGERHRSAFGIGRRRSSTYCLFDDGGRAAPVSVRHRASTQQHLLSVFDDDGARNTGQRSASGVDAAQLTCCSTTGERQRSAFGIKHGRSGTYELFDVGPSGTSQRSASGVDAAQLTCCSTTGERHWSVFGIGHRRSGTCLLCSATGRASPVSVPHRASTPRHLLAVFGDGANDTGQRSASGIDTAALTCCSTTGRAAPRSVSASMQRHLLAVQRRGERHRSAFDIGRRHSGTYFLFNDGTSSTQRSASGVDAAALTNCSTTGRAAPVSVRHQPSTQQHLLPVRRRDERHRSAFGIWHQRSGTYSLFDNGVSGTGQHSAPGINTAALTPCVTTGRVAPVSVRHRAATQRHLLSVRRGGRGTGQHSASGIDAAALTSCSTTGRAAPVSVRHRASTQQHSLSVFDDGESGTGQR
ncbi:hypothetical protein B0H14DRAFT_2618189 [Mycena olivaceomarginata]|nr:hypothetical protein B0H14DRAFT_2618189 [Mycena olivaceomarginata]